MFSASLNSLHLAVNNSIGLQRKSVNVHTALDLNLSIMNPITLLNQWKGNRYETWPLSLQSITSMNGGAFSFKKGATTQQLSKLLCNRPRVERRCYRHSSTAEPPPRLNPPLSSPPPPLPPACGEADDSYNSYTAIRIVGLCVIRYDDNTILFFSVYVFFTVPLIPHGWLNGLTWFPTDNGKGPWPGIGPWHWI